MIIALTLGILSSWHCAGMCGPLFSLILFSDENKLSVLNFILYHFGRIVVYTVIGSIPLVLGIDAITVGWQQVVAILAGLLMLLLIWLPQMKFNGFVGSISQFSRTISRQGFKSKNRFRFLLLGVGNGILPCGLVYIALAAAIGNNHDFPSWLFMLFFGLATLPVFMIMFAIRKTNIGTIFFNLVRKKQNVILSVVALLMILRGLNLGIPFISPEMNNDPIHQNTCCHVGKH